MAADPEILTIQGDDGQITIQLENEGGVESGTIVVDGICYHIERISKRQFLAEYRVDNDPAYSPKADKKGRCVLIAPFSE